MVCCAKLPPGYCMVSAADVNTTVRRAMVAAVRPRATVHGGIEALDPASGLSVVSAPFLTYLTVFRSRLGAAELVLQVTDFRHQSPQSLLRKTTNLLDRREVLTIAEPDTNEVLEYLADKSLLGPKARDSGRYSGISLESQNGRWVARNRKGEELTELPVYHTDIDLSDPRVRSTIGTPTPENASEVVDFALQLRLLTKAKNTWTARAQMVAALRERGSPDQVGNPFLLGYDQIALLSQIIAVDGVMLREVLRVSPKQAAL